MTTISARIIEDSVNMDRGRITTFQLKYPRFIHSELMTHRVFSRNASSSRAIPVKKMIENIREDTAMPMHWGKNRPGMQALEENDEWILLYKKSTFKHGWHTAFETPEEAWLYARDRAIEVAEAFHSANYHKQVVNRLLEPFMHIDVIVTATNFSNWFHLRRHEDAMPEIRILANEMWEEYCRSIPTARRDGSWHIPYLDKVDYDNIAATIPFKKIHNGFVSNTWNEAAIKASVARCARVSYLLHDGTRPSLEKDLALYERLVGSQPLHASPAEHQAMAATNIASGSTDLDVWNKLRGNFDPGWVQYRKLLPDEVCLRYTG